MEAYGEKSRQGAGLMGWMAGLPDPPSPVSNPPSVYHCPAETKGTTELPYERLPCSQVTSPLYTHTHSLTLHIQAQNCSCTANPRTLTHTTYTQPHTNAHTFIWSTFHYLCLGQVYQSLTCRFILQHKQSLRICNLSVAQVWQGFFFNAV